MVALHNAPAVAYPVGRSVLYNSMLVLMLGLGMAALSIWLWHADEIQAIHYAVVCLDVLLWLWAVQAWRRLPQGLLRWDGAVWTLHTGQRVQTVQVQVVLDAQSHVLLCLRPVGPTGMAVWVWPSANKQADRWLALRHALFAPSN
jgi:hypothetical protein